MIKLKSIYLLLVSLLSGLSVIACQCPVTTLSLVECNKYEIIFRGKVDSVKTCNNKFGEAYFTVEELYKGNIPKQFLVLFECDVPCAGQLNAGDEWIIYTNFKQINNGKLDWCSRSRKFFRVAKEDFYTVNYGNDYDDEVNFLQKNLGIHRIAEVTTNASENRNLRPNTTQMVVILICSLAGIILFYWLFNKFFKF